MSDDLTREQREILTCCREDLWTILSTPVLREAVASSWCEGAELTEVRLDVVRSALLVVAGMLGEWAEVRA